MVIVPATALSLYLGAKRNEASSEPDKKALSIIARGFGILGTASGLKSLVAEPSRINLAVALYQETLFVVYHLCNRFTGAWKDAGCEVKRSTAFISCTAVTIAVQGTALACEACEGEDEGKEVLGVGM